MKRLEWPQARKGSRTLAPAGALPSPLHSDRGIEAKASGLAIGGASLESRLRALLKARSPQVVRLLYQTHASTRFDLTYAELEAAVEAGEFSASDLKRWSEAYSKLVLTKLEPTWRAAFFAGATPLQGSLFAWKRRRLPLPTLLDRFAKHLDSRGGELASNLSDSQAGALRALLRHFSTEDQTSPREIARLIRPVIGLTEREASAVARRYTLRRTGGATEGEARASAATLAGKLHRDRADRIATTELATAFNVSQLAVVEEAEAAGFFGDDESPRKVWLTARDEKTCPVCRALDGVSVKLSAGFSAGGLSSSTPPIHPRCRCTLLYKFV